MKRVVERTREDLLFEFDQSTTASVPTLLVGGDGNGYYRSLRVDPCPAYAHDVRLVRKCLRDVESRVELAFKPVVYVLHAETLGRTNGWADRSIEYWGRDDGDEPTWAGHIVLAGKRVPLHPGMTRYLVAHEYGHHVEWELLRRRGLDLDGNDLRDEYAELRGCDPRLPYAPGNWHASAGELMANDFRILVAEAEPEFWPHPGFKRPERVAAVRRWWEEALS